MMLERVLEMQDNQSFHYVTYITAMDIQVSLLPVVREAFVLNGTLSK
jgi:hypothetical protein